MFLVKNLDCDSTLLYRNLMVQRNSEMKVSKIIFINSVAWLLYIFTHPSVFDLNYKGVSIFYCKPMLVLHNYCHFLGTLFYFCISGITRKVYNRRLGSSDVQLSLFFIYLQSSCTYICLQSSNKHFTVTTVTIWLTINSINTNVFNNL